MAKSILALALLAASSDAFQPKAAAPRATVAVSGIRSFLRRYAKGSDPLARRQHWRRREQKRTKIVGVGGPRLLRRRGGGAEIKAETTALLLIEYQNEFTTEGGKLHDAVKDSMAATGMLEKSAKVAAAARDKGVTVIHAPISFAADGSDNPNKGLGILAGCAADKLFTAGEWGAEFHASMAPAAGDLVVEGKKGLDAFPGTNLEQLLVDNKIESVALSGFLTNCCVESSMRTAYEKGFNTITLTDLCATTSPEGQTGATEGTFGMFSAPMTGEEFLGKL